MKEPDPPAATAQAPPTAAFRVGQGFDRHRLEPGASFPLGGVSIDDEFAVVAHSDGDVLLHALIDAVLGASGEGDIGEMFPNSDDRWRDADSAELLAAALSQMRTGWTIGNVDCTIFLQKPKLARYKAAIRERIATLCGLTPDAVNVKAKTGEAVGPVGRSEAVDAAVVVLLIARPG